MSKDEATGERIDQTIMRFNEAFPGFEKDAVNPHFKSYLMRGRDTFQHNPVGEMPQQRYGRITREHLSIEEAAQETWHERS